MTISCPHCNTPVFAGDVLSYLGNHSCQHCGRVYCVECEGEGEEGPEITVGKVIKYDREQTKYLREKLDRHKSLEEAVDLGCSVHVVSAY